MDASGCKMRSSKDLMIVCKPGLQDSMSVERDGAYQRTYRLRKYWRGPISDGIRPIVWREREQKTDVGHHQI